MPLTNQRQSLKHNVLDFGGVMCSFLSGLVNNILFSSTDDEGSWDAENDS